MNARESIDTRMFAGIEVFIELTDQVCLRRIDRMMVTLIDLSIRYSFHNTERFGHLRVI